MLGLLMYMTSRLPIGIGEQKHQKLYMHQNRDIGIPKTTATRYTSFQELEHVLLS